MDVPTSEEEAIADCVCNLWPEIQFPYACRCDGEDPRGWDQTCAKGDALFDNLGSAALRNCILWNNVSPVPGTEGIHAYRSVGTTDVRHSNVKGGWSGASNLGPDVDPLFVDAANDDYRLHAGTPCRNTGHSASLPANVADIGSNGNKTERMRKDLALNSRVEGDSVDMGAFEWHPPGGRPCRL